MPESRRQNSRSFQVAVCLHLSVELSPPPPLRRKSDITLPHYLHTGEIILGREQLPDRISILNYLKKPTARQTPTCSGVPIYRQPEFHHPSQHPGCVDLHLSSLHHVRFGLRLLLTEMTWRRAKGPARVADGTWVNRSIRS